MARIRKLIGKRLFLSPPDPDDAPLYAEWLNDQEVTRTVPMVSRLITEEGERQHLKECKIHSYGIVLNDRDQLIGNCGFINADPLHATAEIGVFIGDRSVWGCGYGREAMSLLIEYGYRALNLRNIMLRCLDYNERGIKSYTALGFKEIGRRRKAHRYDGSWHDVVYMDLLPEEFAPFPV
jgi:RimJ/RimL family protein N-acetyltransferase